MTELIVKIKDAQERLVTELDKAESNQSAARRARKLTLELATLGKEFRKVSVK